MLEPIYDKLATQYDDMYRDPAHQIEDQNLFNLVAKNIDGKILDVGCGTGLLLDNIPIKPKDYIGIDTSPKMLEVFKRKHPNHKTQNIDFEDVDGEYDSIVALYGVASYVKPEYYIKFYHNLSPMGRLMVMFYQPDYYPAYYTDEEKTAVDKNVKHDLIDEVFEHKYTFTNYRLATNFEIPELEP